MWSVIPSWEPDAARTGPAAPLPAGESLRTNAGDVEEQI